MSTSPESGSTNDTTSETVDRQHEAVRRRRRVKPPQRDRLQYRRASFGRHAVAVVGRSVGKWSFPRTWRRAGRQRGGGRRKRSAPREMLVGVADDDDGDDGDDVEGHPLYEGGAHCEDFMAEVDSDDGLHTESYHRHRNDASFWDQLLATLDRELHLMMRNKCALAMEIAIPLIFVLITVILWGAWGDKEMGAAVFIGYNNPDMRRHIATSGEAYRYFCYGPNASQPTPGLERCDAAKGAFQCAGDDTHIPYKGDGFCVYGTSFRSAVIRFLASMQGNLTRVPSLDTMILYQWCALKAGSLRLSDTFGGSFITNRQFYAIDRSGPLYLVGTDDAAVRALEAALANESRYFATVKGGRYRTVAEAKAAMESRGRYWGIVELRSFTPSTYDVVIHFSSKGMADTTQAVDVTYSGGLQENGADLYLSTGFLTLAQLTAEFYLSHVHGIRQGAVNYVASNATPAYTFSPMLRYAYGLVPLIFVLAFLYPVSQQTKRTVLEKETRIREAMLIMGMKNSALYAAQFVVNFSTLSIISLLCTFMVKATFLSDSDVWCIFLFFFLYSLTTIPLAGLISAFFSKARLAALMAPVIYFIIVIPTFVMSSAQGSAVLGFAVFSPSAFASIVSTMLRLQLGGGLAAEDLNNRNNDPTVVLLLVMLVADFILYYILMLYLDAVLPKDWGTPKHPLFFIMEPVQWCCKLKKKRLEGGPDGRAENGVFEDDNYDNDVVQMEGLRKEYQRAGRKFVAVNNFYWGMRPGEISVLLGHNGAGKTTVLNMMTGMIEPDEGDCYVYGLSVRQELSLVRDEIGFCPQHNILWPELTCRDHLEFYAKIKGLKGWELEDAVCRMLSQTDLMEKNYKSKDLSGGQKRKLSVAIAFVGGGRLVYLDEPTAGMDVGARRHLWSLLKNMSEFHTILLTTHYMDEADLLGHRIGIMSHGRLKCSGSSMFLKSNLGVGYCIIISVNPETEVSSIDGLVEDHVDGAAVLSHNGVELSYQLPVRSAAQFPSLLEAIESNDELFGIRGYSLSATTLEEVFLKVSEEDLEGRNVDFSDADLRPLFEYRHASSIYWEQCVAMFTKRFWNALRDRRMQCFQLVCPCVCIVVAMVLSLVRFNGPTELLLDHRSVYWRDGVDSQLPTAQCDRWWGTAASLPGTEWKETHYPNAEHLSYYMLDNWASHSRPVYGAIACQDVDLAAVAGVGRANVFIYNGSAPHQSGINMALYYDSLVKYFTGNASTMKLSAGIMYDTAPLQDPMKMLVTGILIMIPFAFLPSNPVAWVVKERECGAMHQQRLAGLNFYVYWICNFVFDLFVYLIAVLLILLILALFQKEEFVGADRISATCVLFVVYGFTSTAMAYFLSVFFKEHSSAQTTTMGSCFVVAFLLIVAVYVLALKPENEAASNKLRWICRLFPTFCVGESILDLMLLKQLIESGQAQGAWDMQPIGYAVIYLAVEFPIFVVLALVVHHPQLRKYIQMLRYRRKEPPILPSDADSDVEEERAAVHEAETGGKDSTDVIRVLDLQKKYANGKVAVKGITFSVFPREVFAFLGTNGAGKTTTMSMLCQQFLPTGGSAYINGYDIVGQSGDAMASMGFCPQFDATFDLLTVEEHLNFYAQVHGIARKSRQKVIKALLRLCELTMYRNTQAAQLSGGNGRKLSVAMSLMGGPQVVFLDEPSAGMDPVARRGMWTTIQRASKHCSIVLTTHHLEEVEALADIVAIMVDGTLRCIGDKIHLKNKFGSGFEMSIRIQSELYREGVEAFIEEHIPGAVMSEFKSNRFVYELPSDGALSDVFAIIQSCQDELGITDYCVSQTSIEQVFLEVSERAHAVEED